MSANARARMQQELARGHFRGASLWRGRSALAKNMAVPLGCGDFLVSGCCGPHNFAQGLLPRLAAQHVVRVLFV